MNKLPMKKAFQCSKRSGQFVKLKVLLFEKKVLELKLNTPANHSREKVSLVSELSRKYLF